MARHCITLQKQQGQIETSVDTAHSGCSGAWGPVCLGLDRRIRPHKPWAFTNLGSLDRSLGPLYLILVCPRGGAVSHLPVAPLIVPEASVG